MGGSNAINLTGQRFGRLTVQERHSLNKHRQIVWLCKCDCGNRKLVCGSNLRTGNTTSCGCYQRDHTRKLFTKPNSGSALAYVIDSYKRESERRNIAWRLTETQAESLVRSVCFYCGATPQRRLYKHKEVFFNGIDRVDNSKGYQPNNVVACCKICNRAKSTMVFNEFIAWIERLCKNLTIKGVPVNGLP